MALKKIIGKVHLWLGFISGLLVFIISITGCIYAFQEEIQHATQQYRYVAPQNKPYLPPSVLADIAKKQLPDKHLHGIQYYKSGKAAQAIFYHYDPSHYYSIFLNPYTGAIQKVVNLDEEFFRIVLMGHFYLWLPPEIGQPIVASATIVFIVMLISGIVLWWPRNKSASKQRFTIKRGTSWKRKNYDMHNVLGFYSSFIVLVLAITGLVWGFEWFKNSLHFIVGGKSPLVYQEPASDFSNKGKNTLMASTVAVDKVWDFMREEYPTAHMIEVHVPETDTSSIAANANLEEGTYWKTDYRYFDQYTLKELSVNHNFGRLADANFGDKLLRMNYDIHVGAILGLPGKILAFSASLIFASLPITGCYIWWGRRKKKKKKAPLMAETSI